MIGKLAGLKTKYETISQQIADPEVIADMKRFVQLNKEYRELEPLVAAGDRYARMVHDLEAAKEILQVEKDKQIELEDNQIIEIIAKESKKRKDSIEDYKKSGREDLVNQTNAEIEVLTKYLPKQLSKEELEEQEE